MAFEHLFDYDHGIDDHRCTRDAHRAWANRRERARVDAAFDQLAAAAAEGLAGVADPLEVAAWGRRVEARVAAVRLAALAEADRRGAARNVGALGTEAWLTGQGVAAGAARRDVALAGALADPESCGDPGPARLRWLTPGAGAGDHPRQATPVRPGQRGAAGGVRDRPARPGPDATPQELELAAEAAAARVDPPVRGPRRLERRPGHSGSSP